MSEKQLIVCLTNILFLMMSHISFLKRMYGKLKIDL